MLFYKKILSNLIKKHRLYAFWRQSRKNSHVDMRPLKACLTDSFLLKPKKPKIFIFSNIKKGNYRIVVSHVNENVFNNRRSMLAAFDLYEVRNVENKKKYFGLQKVSPQYGVFEHLGGGKQVNGMYIQDVYLNLPSSIKFLRVKFLSLLSEEVQIQSCQLIVQNSSVAENINLMIESGPKDNAELNSGLESMKLAGLIPDSNFEDTEIVIYADISPNVIDGSSIWLTSVINILSMKYKVLVLLKDDVNPNKNILSNIISKNAILVEPKNLHINAPLNNERAVSLLKIFDQQIPHIRAVVTRGYDLALAIQADDTFVGRRFVYLTDFYKITDSGFEIPDARQNTLPVVLSNADYILAQTPQILDKLKDISLFPLRSIMLPPAIPADFQTRLTNIEQEVGFIHIGYAGKIQPRWGVEELLQWADELVQKNIPLKLHIATGKIYSANKQDGFVAKLQKLLKRPFIKIYNNLDRFAAMSLMNSMDYVWCYRDEILENNTLEVSTKLIEMGALGKPCLAYPSAVNQDLLGRDYPFFIRNKADFINMLSSPKVIDQISLSSIAERIFAKHTFEGILNNFDRLSKFEYHHTLREKKIAVAGHDLKFINPWISSLKSQNIAIKTDVWEWGAIIDKDRANSLIDWADILFCEWGLANAVWYSQNNVQRKPLFIRMHAQEVRDKAKKFGASINIDNVSKVIFVAEHIRNKALELWGWPKEKTVVVPNFVQADKYHLRTEPLTVNLGLVGMIPQTKRLDRAIELLEKLLEQGLDSHLYIKGHRPEDLTYMQAPGRKQEMQYYYDLYERIKQSDMLRNHIHFDGWGNDVSVWYQKIDFILSPSDSESFHYALADGVLSGCLPIVWNWQNAESIYTKDWIVDNAEQAVELIKLAFKKSEYEYTSTKSFNRDLLLSRYGSNLVYEKINKILCIN